MRAFVKYNDLYYVGLGAKDPVFSLSKEDAYGEEPRPEGTPEDQSATAVAQKTIDQAQRLRPDSEIAKQLRVVEEE
jgi:hypothetical protein